MGGRPSELWPGLSWGRRVVWTQFAVLVTMSVTLVLTALEMGPPLFKKHMAEAGHTRIAHVAGPSPYIHARIRREAFTAAMAEHGLDGSLVVEGAFTAASGRDATAQLLDLADPPTAIVYANDTMAISGLSLAHSRGIRVPEELSISGYDDSELSAHLSPGLTTVSTGAVQRGEIAVRTLLAALDGEEPGAVRADHTVVVPRGSIAAPQG